LLNNLIFKNMDFLVHNLLQNKQVKILMNNQQNLIYYFSNIIKFKLPFIFFHKNNYAKPYI